MGEEVAKLVEDGVSQVFFNEILDIPKNCPWVLYGAVVSSTGSTGGYDFIVGNGVVVGKYIFGTDG